MEKPEELRVGSWLRWAGSEWEVTERNTYSRSGDYNEIHWKLEPDMGQERYLVLSRENKGGSVEEFWVCTREADITKVEYQAQPGQWAAFRETDSVKKAPAVLRFDNLDFTLQGETSGMDEDDDGNTVPTLTWDYYDASRTRNLAIEIWKEPDADYFEAYDGNVTRPAELELLPPRTKPIARKISESSGAAVIFIFSCVFFVPLLAGILTAVDIGGEYALAGLVPALFILIAWTLSASRGPLAAVLVCAVLAALATLKFRGLGASYWEYCIYGTLAGPALAEMFEKLFPSAAGRLDKPLAAAAAAMLNLYIISFAHYITVAPRPHNPGMLLVACALPLAPAALVLIFYKAREGMNAKA